MACACKRKADAVAAVAGENGEEQHGLLWKIFTIPFQFLFGIVAFALIILMIAPMMVYLLFCLVTGREASFRLTKKGIKIGKGKKKESNG